MRAPLRWVLWDIKDTLMTVRGSVGEQYAKEAERLGLSLSPAEVNAAFSQVYRRYNSAYPNYGVSRGLNGQNWWVTVVKETLSLCRVQDPVLLNTVANNVYRNFNSAENWEVYSDSKQALQSCSSFGLELGVVSNFDIRLEEVLRSCGLLSHFSFLVSSEEAGVAKPNPAIFAQALQKCGTAAEGVAHVGDQYVNDYLAARSVGIHGFLLDRHNKHKDSDVPPDQRISSLEELPSRLQQLMA
nr:haloacid dehalogenase-like hydrolase domain-containing protein 3 [Nothobranchius furzeri]XP_015814345.2 haloacid dehalogenase-like hydrolase domain-containing protein 3 [Nothobranchius furzeri]XP_015814346.2 haloacid dehalogenase-like hydrolase domain-containing protein 3 [Nothobranchius furzeri]XP_015814348.2 haloacid dehalogenase-like hydrolase domain-containing protein 3 [Nothobranchius furzeri]XP_054586811.1 haloacid dehalogenase-like hydrolase domain-containing protein 3 [Nothobranchius